MIISITGKPCSGKGSVGKYLSKIHNFEYISTGDIFREESKKYNVTDILAFNKDENITKIDYLVDERTKKIGATRLNDNIIFDSRLAWHFIPKSFKVFIDVNLDVAGKRLMSANRKDEKSTTINNAKQRLKDRWNTENNRYLEIYGVTNLDLKNYDLVVSSSNRSVEEVADIIWEKYQKFLKNQVK